MMRCNDDVMINNKYIILLILIMMYTKCNYNQIHLQANDSKDTEYINDIYHQLFQQLGIVTTIIVSS